MPARKSPMERFEFLMQDVHFEASQRTELISLLCALLREGMSADEMRKAVESKWPEFAELITREDPWALIRAAASQGWLTFQAPIENELASLLEKKYDWETDTLTVVHSPHFDHVALQAAQKLLKEIRNFKTYGHLETVHIGFAGGRLLRQVAKELATLLRGFSKHNPTKLIFHAMVAAFGDDDFEADPNNFITFFLQEPLAVSVGFVPMAAPGIVETKLRPQLREFRGIREVYKAAESLNIIVSSGGNWQDEHSTAQTYLRRIDKDDANALDNTSAIGDLLWQPVSDSGPVNMDDGNFTFRPNTLVDLNQLPEAIKRGTRVLLALGPCGECGKPKGKLLDTILKYRPQLVTDVVTNSPTAYDTLQIAFKNERS